MKDMFTPYYEDDADRFLPILAKASGSTNAVFSLLLSRSWATGNVIKWSQAGIAKHLEISDDSVSRAFKWLEKHGLIEYDSTQGAKGTTISSIINPEWTKHPELSKKGRTPQSCGVKTPQGSGHNTRKDAGLDPAAMRDNRNNHTDNSIHNKGGTNEKDGNYATPSGSDKGVRQNSGSEYDNLF